MTALSTKRKDILLTGASGAIGGAMARRLAAAGFTLHLTSREVSRLANLSKDIARIDTRPYTYTLDLLDLAQCGSTVDRFFREAKNPFGLICNAGDLGVLGPFLEVDFAEWKRSLDQNFIAHAAMIQSFGRHFATAGKKGGSIILLSGAGLGGAVNHMNLSSYGTAKAALTYLAEALALELAPLEITINAIAPGQVNSGITEQALRAGVERAGDYARSAQKCKESGGVSPDFAAQIAEFLMSPEARYITGRLLSARFDQKRLREKTDIVVQDPHLYRLRRIDHDLFGPEEKKP